MKRLLAVLGVLGAWAVVAVAGAAPALAHATVVATDPADSSRLEAAPSRVTVTFSESVSADAGFLKVVDGTGAQVSVGTPTSSGRQVSVPLRSGLGDGSYVVSYRIVSSDSHPISGAYAFVVGDGPLVGATGSVLGGSTDPVVNAVFTAVRWLSFAGVVVLGGLAFVVLCWPAGRTRRRARRLIWAGWTAAAAGAVLGLLLEGPYAAGTGIGDALDTDLLRTTLSSTYGRMLCGRLVLLGALAALATRMLREQEPAAEKARDRDEDLAAICGLGVLATYGGVGHAAAGSTPTLALLSDTIHLAAASLWIGGLVLLATCLLPGRHPAELAEALPRFSRLALGSVTVLVGTGLYQAWREVWPLPALWSTRYGLLLLTKVGLVALVVAVAWFSRQAVRRRYVTPVVHALSVRDGEAGGVATATGGAADGAGDSPDAAEQDRMLRRLRTSVGIELALLTGVLAVVAVLVSTAPARASYVDPVDRTVQLASGGSAEVRVTPARVGANTIRVTVRSGQGGPADTARVTATLELPAAQIGPLPVPLSRAGAGSYIATSVSMPRAGTWELVLRVQTSEFSRDVTQLDLPVR